METQFEKNPQKVLWVVDLSKSPQKVFKDVEAYKTEGSEIHILYVGEDTAHHPGWYGAFKPEHADRIQKKEIARADKYLNQICEKYLDGCQLYMRHFDVGNPIQKVLGLIKKELFDLIIIPFQFVPQDTNGEDSIRTIKAIKNTQVRIV